MRRSTATLPHTTDQLFLSYVGMETDLIFNKGIDLPGFATYPLLESDTGRDTLTDYFNQLIDLGVQAGAGVILESPTWVANRDRGAELGYTPDTLVARNVEGLNLMAEVRQAHPHTPVILSANIGPRADAYAPAEQMTADAAETYHAEQIAAAKGSFADVVSAYTLAYPAEAIGIARAARAIGLPAVISFTVETDGRLPTGTPLPEAIATVDAATEGAVAYYMVNCAHPDHFDHVLDGGPWMHRLKGLVANASRCSHAELDEAEELDDGDPQEFGQQLATLRRAHPSLNVLGGCCGTDMRHMQSIVHALSA